MNSKTRDISDSKQLYKIFTERPDGLVFNIYLTPGASKTCITGLRYDDVTLISIKMSVHGKPVENKANIDLIKFISDEFALPKSYIIIISGQKSRHKRILLLKYTIGNIPQKIQDLLIDQFVGLQNHLLL